ncbi:MAG: TonB-dependent receptor plug domain-containing protein [Myxococcota bacterium]
MGAEEEVLEAAPIRVEADTDPAPRVYEATAIETEIVDREEIEALPIADVADAVKTRPGFRVQQRIQGEQAVVSIEGLPPEYTRVLVNGQRFTGRLGEAADLADLPSPICIDRIELQRGSQTLRYGTDAGGGAINVITRKPPEEGGYAVAEGGGGQDERWLGSAALGQSFGPVGGVLCLSHEEEAGYDPRVDPDEGVFVGIGGNDTKYETDDVYTTWSWSPSETLELFAQGGYREDQDDFVRFDGVDLGNLDFERTLVSSGFDWQASERADVHASVLFFRGITDNSISREFRLDEDQTEIDASAAFYFDTGPVGHALSAGVDLRRPTLDLDEEPLPFEPAEDTATLSNDRQIQKDRTDTGYVLQLDSEIFARMHLVTGLRLQTSSSFDEEWLPQVALLYSPLDWLSLRASYARNVRYPSLRELYQPDTAQLGGLYFLGGNPELDPEKSDSFRVGFEITSGEWFAFGAVGYWNEIDDFIRSRPFDDVQIGENFIPGDPDDPFCQLVPGDPSCSDQFAPVFGEVFRPFNLDEVRTRGVEATARFRWRPYVDLNVGYTYQDTHVDSKIFPDLDELPNEPEHTVDIQLVLQSKPWGRWLRETRLGTTARWRDEALVEVSGTGLSNFTSTTMSDPSWQVDMRLTQVIGDHVQVYADVRNLTDEKTVDSYQIRGRTFFGGARIELDWGFDPLRRWFNREDPES